MGFGRAGSRLYKSPVTASVRLTGRSGSQMTRFRLSCLYGCAGPPASAGPLVLPVLRLTGRSGSLMTRFRLSACMAVQGFRPLQGRWSLPAPRLTGRPGLLVLFSPAPAHQSSWATYGCMHWDDMVKAVCHLHCLVLSAPAHQSSRGDGSPHQDDMIKVVLSALPCFVGPSS